LFRLLYSYIIIVREHLISYVYEDTYVFTFVYMRIFLSYYVLVRRTWAILLIRFRRVYLA